MNTGIILVIDTSNGLTAVAVYDNGSLLAEVADQQLNSQLENISTLVAKALKEAGLGLSDIDLILLGQGPGSFTGLRIGYSFAAGIAAATGLPVATASSFYAMAINHFVESAESSSKVSIHLPAGRTPAGEAQVICGKYFHHVETDLTEEAAKPSIVDLADCSSKSIDCRELQQRSTISITAGLLRLSTRKLSSTYSHNCLHQLKPDYVRAVAAKKIVDR